MSNDNLVQILILVAVVIVCLIFILIAALIVMNAKEKKRIKEAKEKDERLKQVKKSQVVYTPESILDFMEFEKIEDNMIIQKNGKFLMIVECKGINYDLMSEMEKVSVEQGFISFLNTLRHPLQIYIQTRTINLERSIEGYKNRLKNIEKKYDDICSQYEEITNNNNATSSQIDKIRYEMLKQRNLKEYTEDIIRDIEKQSLNKNILSKKYFIVIPCYQSEVEAGDFDKNEIKNMAFSELYTRARAVINSLFSCQVNGKILNSEELADLLYMAYNRDEADLFWLEKMKKVGFDELYSTAPDVTDKKLKLLNKQIEDEAVEKANQKINEAKSEKELEIIEKEKNKDKIVNKKAIDMVRKHRKYIGTEVADKALEKLENTSNDKKEKMQKEKNKEENEDVNVQEKTTTRRGRAKKIS